MNGQYDTALKIANMTLVPHPLVKRLTSESLRRTSCVIAQTVSSTCKKKINAQQAQKVGL